ncbi:MAG TPA: c-type cytochrome [Thioalkalivibrio sp.]|nr:c-type cytochrome [Thioalkalivibrio sp.]
MSKFLLGLSVVVMLVVVVFLATRLLNVIERAGAPDEPSAMAQSMTDDRIRPIGRVVSAAMDTANDGAQRSASEIYGAGCAACHDTGAAGAPRKGDEAAWAERMGKGFDAVLANSINGIGAMPARGGDASLSDDDMRQVVTFLLTESGVEVDTGAASSDSAPEESSGNDAAGDASAGQAKFASCAACHGAQGEGQGIFPKLAGTPADRIAELLKRYRAGEEVGPQSALMAPNASGLSDEDISDLAAYIDSL